jgi:hypothetical protein
MRRLASVILGTMLLAAPLPAAIVVPDSPAPPAARAVLAEVAAAFGAGDHDALAGLVHPDGVRVALSPAAGRSSELTPAQAHYYFKNLFQGVRTVAFDYLRHSGTDDARVHAVAVWRQRDADAAGPVARRLLVTLARDGEAWRLTEIMTLRGG